MNVPIKAKEVSLGKKVALALIVITLLLLLWAVVPLLSVSASEHQPQDTTPAQVNPAKIFDAPSLFRCRSAKIYFVRGGQSGGVVTAFIWDIDNQETIMKSYPFIPSYDAQLKYGIVYVGPVPKDRGWLQWIEMEVNGPYLAHIRWHDCLDVN